jgi:hypothetical protein
MQVSRRKQLEFCRGYFRISLLAKVRRVKIYRAKNSGCMSAGKFEFYRGESSIGETPDAQIVCQCI